MRISGVTGDLPAVAHLVDAAPPEPPAAGVAPPPAVPPATAATGAGADGSTDRRQERQLTRVFDPPLIAQRAVLGLPVGQLIAELAESEQMTFSAACAAVDREMPRDAD